jgi:hypothetical protein
VSYVIQIWEQPADVTLPAHPGAVWEMLDQLFTRSPGPNPKYAELARQLMVQFPETDDPDGEGQVWLDGRADGSSAALVWSLGLCSCDQLDQVHAAIVTRANALGLHVADEQSGGLHLAPSVTPPAATPAPAAPLLPTRNPALVDETPTEPVPFDPPAPVSHQGAPSAEARSVMARAERRDPDARFELGRLFKLGRGVERSDELAVHWWTLAAELGQRDAQYSLGVAHVLGEGTEKSELKAFKWFCQAADQAHPDALYNLGQMYSEGTVTPKDTVVGSALSYCAHKLGCRHAKPVFQAGETARAMALAALIAQSGGKVLDTLAAWKRAEARATPTPPPAAMAAKAEPAGSSRDRQVPPHASPTSTAAAGGDRIGWLPRVLRRFRGQVA